MSTKFRPRLPIDPFQDQWHIQPNPPPCQPQVILTIGHPTKQDLTLLSSSSACSLVLIATDSHVEVDTTVDDGPHVRILKLSQPIPGPDSTALGLVSLFDRAATVARNFKPGSLRVEELVEDPVTAEFVSSKEASQQVKTRRRTSRLPSFSSSTTPRSRSRYKQQPFDGLIHFISPQLSERALLRISILVTTLAQQYLSSPTSSFPSPQSSFAYSNPNVTTSHHSQMTPPPSVFRERHLSDSSSNLSTTSNSSSRMRSWYKSARSSRVSLPVPEQLAKATRSHIIHVLAVTKPSRSVIKNMEHFFISYAYPAVKLSSAESSNTQEEWKTKPAPFLVSSDILSSHPPHHQQTILQLILGGALDPTAAPSSFDQHPMRAWINSASDIVVSDSSQESTLSTSSVSSSTMGFSESSTSFEPLVRSRPGSSHLSPLSERAPSLSPSRLVSSTSTYVENANSSEKSRYYEKGPEGILTPPDSSSGLSEEGTGVIETSGSGSSEAAHTPNRGKGDVVKRRWSSFWKPVNLKGLKGLKV